jgi:hypothetical protein
MISLLDIKTMFLYIRHMTQSREERDSRSDKVSGRAMILDWLPALIALMVLSLIQELGLFGSDGTWKLFWSLLNLAPALWVVRAVVRGLRRADEFQRRRQLEAMAIGFGVMMMAIFTVGLLQAAGVGDLRQLVQISFGGSTLVWVGTLWIQTQRVR